MTQSLQIKERCTARQIQVYMLHDCSYLCMIQIELKHLRGNFE
jgi:hypothetical protein